MSLGFDERDRARVVADLASPDEDVRRLAVERVEVLPSDAALPLLVERLGDPSWRVRKAAIEHLVACPDAAKLATVLIAALADGDNPGRRNGAVEAFVRCGSRLVPALLGASGSDDPDVRKLVVDALAGAGDAQAGETLVHMLADPDPNVRAASADALGGIGSPQAGPALLERARCESEDPLVRFSALRALAELGTPVAVSDIADALEDPILRAVALDLLGGEDGPEVSAVLLKALTASSRTVREAAMRGLLRLVSHVESGRAEELSEAIRAAAVEAPDLVADAIERLEQGEPPARLAVAQFLGLARPSAAVVPLLRAARDETLREGVFAALVGFGPGVEAQIESAWADLAGVDCSNACALLGRTRGEQGTALLVQALDGSDGDLRAAAARGVAERGAVEALTTLVSRLERVAESDEFEAEEERADLAEALVDLARSGSEARARVAAALEQRMEAASESLRVLLARVLGEVALPEEQPLFVMLLKDPSAEVRRAAVEALARIDPGSAVEPLRLALADEDATVRIAAVGAFSLTGSDAALRDLGSLADDPDPRVRAAAVAGMARWLSDDAGEESRAAARKAVEAGLEDDALVALAALEALLRVGGELALGAAALLDRSEPELVREAVRCLGRHAGSQSLGALLPLVSHEDWSVRAEAISVLAERRVMQAAPAILRLLEKERDAFVREAILKALQRLEG